MNRETIEWCQFYWFDTPFSDRPRILLIGDSIVVGHAALVAEQLRPVATVGFYATSKIVGDPAYSRELALALADYPVDLICFNNGLHGLDLDDETYRRGLEETVDFLAMTTPRARLLWRNSTPVTEAGSPQKFDARNQIVLRRNRIAAELMAARGVECIDLYSEMAGHGEFGSGDGFHYNAAGCGAQSVFLAGKLREALENKSLFLEINGFHTDYPGVVTDFHGFEARHFHVNGHKCVIVKPNGPVDPERRWFWRARFFGAFPAADLALLKSGWHVVNIDIAELYGSPDSNERMTLLYNFMTGLAFNRKCHLAGFSRGGLDSLIWGNRNPEKVAAIYLDNAVCDFKSWPGGRGRLPRYDESWKNCLKAWHFTEDEALRFSGNPVDRLENLAKAHVPLLFLCGDADEVVAPEENTLKAIARYQELGGRAELITKPGAKHHPHCLVDPAPIVRFLTQ